MRLLITGAWSEAGQYIPELKRMGHETAFLQWERDALPCPYDWPEGVICNGLFLHHPIEQFTNLRFIQLTSAGADRIPMDYIQANGIELHTARGVYSVPMAEFAVCGVLELYKRSRFFWENQKARRWEKRRDLLELCGKTVCIVGCGSVGTECAKRFGAFGCRVIGVDLVPREDAAYERIVPLTRLDEALDAAHVVVLALPLTDDTRHLMDAERFARMKPGATLVNISRGAVVDPAALEAAMPRLGGAVLDVFEEEPLPESSPLWAMENIILTPHNSFAGEGNGARLAKVIIKNVNGLE